MSLIAADPRRAHFASANASTGHDCVEIPLDDDAHLRALRWNGRGTACLMLHGLADAACVWRDFASRIRTQFQPIAVDLRGHGFSSWDATAQYDIQTLVNDVERAIEFLGIDQLILVGHSLGGDTAIRLAAQTTARIAAVVLVDVGPEFGKAGVERVSTDLLEMPWVYDSISGYTEWLAGRRPLSHAGLLDELARYALRARADGRFELRLDPALRAIRHSNDEAVDGLYRDETLWQALRRIECPTLVVRGLGSALLPIGVARSMVDKSLPRGSLVEVECAGHSVMTDNPDGFHAAVADFLQATSLARR